MASVMTRGVSAGMIGYPGSVGYPPPPGTPREEDPVVRARRLQTEADIEARRQREVQRQHDELDLRDRRRDPFQDITATLKQIMSTSQSSLPPRIGSPGMPGHVSMGGGSGSSGSSGPAAAGDTRDAALQQSLAFSRAKDISGRVGQQAIQALKDQMSARGMGGSGLEGELTGDIISNVARHQSQAEFDAAREADERAFQQKLAEYTGGITQRGQDIGYLSSIYGGGITQRGQDIGAMPDMTSIVTALLNARRRSY